MRNLMIVLLMTISFASVEAQITLETKNMITIKNGKRTSENLESKIVINSDTTEIDLYFKGAHVNEKIGELYSTFEEGTYSILVYKQENDEMLIFHFLENKLFSVVFQTSNNNGTEYN